jgi:hypothetical protein
MCYDGLEIVGPGIHRGKIRVHMPFSHLPEKVIRSIVFIIARRRFPDGIG